jgi:hypothetical protein
LRDRWNRLWFTYPEYQQWSAAQRSFSAIALYGDQQMAMTGAGDAVQTAVATATPNLMSVLGTHVALGRWFLPNEVGTGTERLAVISSELWQTRFGGDSGVVGRSILLDDNAFRIVGVLPADFSLSSLTSTTRGSRVDLDSAGLRRWRPTLRQLVRGDRTFDAWRSARRGRGGDRSPGARGRGTHRTWRAPRVPTRGGDLHPLANRWDF